MLRKSARMRQADDFRLTVRRGVRVGRPTMVLHAVHDRRRAGVRVGFVVSKAVGGAVRRNRVKRQLRHLVANQLLLHTPGGTDLVVRALPPAAEDSARLRVDLVSAWSSAVVKLNRAALS